MVKRCIRKGDFNKQGAWKTLSKSCQSFIQAMLTLDPTKRPKAEELLNHAWFTSTDDQGEVSKVSHHAVSSTDESAIHSYESMAFLYF